MRVESLYYELPAELIAQHPAPRREDARLLCVRQTDLFHGHVRDLLRLLPPRAMLVVNDSRVLPARLLGRKAATGGRVELLLVERLAREPMQLEDREVLAERWSAMARSSRGLRDGTEIVVGSGLRVQVLSRSLEQGLVELRLHGVDDRSVPELVEQEGRMPLPPYVRRPPEPADRERYQTVYARVPGAVAAPTAGLHLSTSLLAALGDRGVQVLPVTLHVGPGTFRPVTAADLDEHPMHAERFIVSAETAAALSAGRAAGRPVVAVGTTVVRALESCAAEEDSGAVRAMHGETRLLIQPGFRFKVVDELLTNFHLPGSTLLALAFAFGGTERVREAYREAIRLRYRFYSYGDAMLLCRCGAGTGR